MLLRCTTKLLKLLGSRGGALVDAEPAVDDWYANVFTVERRKCLLLVHADTLFSLLDVDVRVVQLDDLGTYVATRVVDALTSEGLTGTALGPTDPARLRIAKTASRSVLGHMTEMALDAEYLIDSGGGLRATDIDDVTRQLRRHLRGRGGDYVVPLELPSSGQSDGLPATGAAPRASEGAFGEPLVHDAVIAPTSGASFRAWDSFASETAECVDVAIGIVTPGPCWTIALEKCGRPVNRGRGHRRRGEAVVGSRTSRSRRDSGGDAYDADCPIGSAVARPLS